MIYIMTIIMTKATVMITKKMMNWQRYQNHYLVVLPLWVIVITSEHRLELQLCKKLC